METTGIFTTEWLTNSTTSPTTTTTTTPIPDVTTVSPEDAPIYILKQITGDIPEFEIILPCIFGIFIMLSLSLMVFYTKGVTDHKTKVLEMDAKIEKQVEGKKTDSHWF